MEKYFMEEAIKEAQKGIRNGDGGPFGCIIAKDGKIIGRGHNLVISHNDPTAHGEITAIRNACANLNSFSLKGCEMYSTAEPCPMCLGAALWARIDKIYYGCNIEDSKKIGFDDSRFYEIFSSSEKNEILKSFERESCLKVFEEYEKTSQRINY